MYDVFLSHASEDKEAFVRPLALALRDAGLKPPERMSKFADMWITPGLVAIRKV